jgi:hypothetical protein
MLRDTHTFNIGKSGEMLSPALQSTSRGHGQFRCKGTDIEMWSGKRSPASVK